MEGALVALAMKAGLDPARIRAEWRRADEIPFDARYRYMATRHAAPAGGQTVFVKGAPEQLLAMCAAEATEAGPQPVDHDYWNARIARTASEGERVLGFAVKTSVASPGASTDGLSCADLEAGLVFLGLVGLVHPPPHRVIPTLAQSP